MAWGVESLIDSVCNMLGSGMLRAAVATAWSELGREALVGNSCSAWSVVKERSKAVDGTRDATLRNDPGRAD